MRLIDDNDLYLFLTLSEKKYIIINIIKYII